MKAKILLNHTENTQRVEEEEKARFLHSILEQMGVPIQELWADDNLLSIDQKIKLRGLLTTFSIQVIDNRETMSIFVEGEKVAEFFKPHYKLKIDLSQLDRKKQPYIEMLINCWSLFEEADDHSENT